VSGEQGDRLLRKLEPPAHDKWDKNRGESNNKKSYEEIYNWLSDKLKEIANKEHTAPEEIPQMNKYLPSDISLENSDNSPSVSGADKTNQPDKETADQTSEIQGSQPKEPKNVPIIKPATRGGKKQKKPKNTNGEGTGTGVTPGEGRSEYIDASDIKKIRIYETIENNNRLYIMKITPNEDIAGHIRIKAIGDDQNIEVDIQSAENTADGSSYEIKNGCEIKGVNLKKDVSLTLKIKLNNNRRYALGVE